MNNRRTATKKEKGQSLVELGFSMTFLLLLLAGVADIGRAYFTFISLRDAAQEGAAYGSTHPTFCTQIVERVQASATSPVDMNDIPAANIKVRINGLECNQAVANNLACAPNEIQVQVIVEDFDITTPFLGTVLGRQQLKLTADITDTIVSNPCVAP
jgi:Flp pilus assembly protein TadG